MSSAVLAGATPGSASFPGPLIVGNKGDQLRINVKDQLTNSTSLLTTTSIHWHGFFQQGTQWADGPVGVSQCRIFLGESFLYQFNVQDQAGSFWYHSHHGTQYCDGLRGPLVVYDPFDPLRHLYDSTVITLADWYHIPSGAEPLIAAADSTLINGLGGGPSSPLVVINTVIEADGVETNPVTVDSIRIFAGQRYSFILETDQPTNSSEGTTTFANGLNSAIFVNPLLETSLSPLRHPGVPREPFQGGADINLNPNIVFNTTDLKLFINGASFKPPTVPVILSGTKTPQELLPPGSVYVLPRNKVVEVSIPSGSPGSPHPFHLHGQTFGVVRSAGNSSYNYVNPVRRDVVSTGIAGDNVTFRFSTENPGPWILHCHIDWHLNLGLAIVFAMDVETTSEPHPPIFPIYQGVAYETKMTPFLPCEYQ
ncbi:laccase [Amanita rubescens]|nr:laccase [Amanita rubescens]